MDKKINNYSGKYLNKIVLMFILVMGLSGCGGGGDSAPQQNLPVNDPASPPVNNPALQSIIVGAIKGPLVNSVVSVFSFDSTKPGFKGNTVTTGVTDGSTAITSLDLPLPLDPPYIMEFTSNVDTRDMTTNAFPVITTMRTVITQGLLDSAEPIYATPLTTMAVDIAAASAGPGATSAQFKTALITAAAQTVSTLGFGLDSAVDIFATPAVIDSTTETKKEQANVAAYRSSVEALTAIAYQIGQQSMANADDVLSEFANDLADDGVINGSAGALIDGNTLQLLQQVPAVLPIPSSDPNFATNLTIADINRILADEADKTAPGVNVTALSNIITVTAPAKTSPDIDGDGVLNVDDAFPNDATADTDTDADRLPDIAYTDSSRTTVDAARSDADDDNDNWLDTEDDFPFDATRFLDPALDRDNDTVANGSDNCPLTSNTNQADANTNGLGDVCDDDVDGDGVANDGTDNCPIDANPAQSDTDSDGTGDACDSNIDNDSEPNSTDAFPFDSTETIDTDADGIGNNTDIDDDNDGVIDTLETDVSPLPGGELCSLLQDCDGDGVLDGADASPTDPNVGINFAPIANNDTVTVNEDAVAFLIDVTANDIGDVVNLTAFSPNNSSLGSLVISGNSIEYTPVHNANGTDTFSYTVTDGTFFSQGSVNVTVVAVNDRPVAADDVELTNEDSAVITKNVLNNDTDVDGDVLSVLPGNPAAANGALVNNDDGTFLYTPNVNYSGTDSFTYTVIDGNGGSTTGTVNITINAINDIPVAIDDSITTNEDVSITTSDVRLNDFDVENDPLIAVLSSNANNGNVADNGNGTFTYIPDSDFNGTDSFSYTLADNSSNIVPAGSTAFVFVTVNPVNDAPVANNDSSSVREGLSVNINLAANDIDIDNSLDLSSIVITLPPSNGTVVLNVNGTVDYTHNGSAAITDSFAYTIKDNSGAESNIATVSLEVSAINIGAITDVTIGENSIYTGAIPIISGTPVGSVAYSLSGSDAALFTINSSTGVVSMIARDFESPVDANTDNIYNLSVTAADTVTNSATTSWSVTVTDVTETATFSINPISNASINENSVYSSIAPTMTGTPIGVQTYTLGGTDAGLFTINSNTGVVNMVARDFENPADAGANNVYDLSLTVTDADGNSDSEPWNVTVVDVTEAATFIIDAINNASVNENSIYTSVIPAITGTSVGDVTYALSGTDAAAFTINAATGVVSMVARDFEAPVDANTDNIYALTITAADADLNSASQSWNVTVADVTEAATFTIDTINNASVNENSVYTSVMPSITGVPIGAVTYTLSGTDAAAFTINAATGVVSMVARDFENPADTNTDNLYALSIAANDVDGNSASQSWNVTVADVTEAATFTIDTINNASVNENSAYTSVIPAITGTSVGVVTYALGGADAALFTINSSSGVVSMVARDFENPVAAGANNVYDLSLTVTDADGNSDSEPWNVTVVDVTEAAIFTIDAINNASVNENSVYTSVIPAITGTPIGAVTYALSGVDAADFTIDASTGVVSMVARDFENPTDAGANNVYDLSITVTDADGNSDSEPWSLAVVDVVEASVISINALANTSVNENNVYTSIIPTITGTPIGAVTYILSGTDAASFTINAATGVVSMVARDFENPVDANTDNIYDLSITVTDADTNSASTSWSVNVVDLLETATFTIDAINNASVNENSAYTSVIPAITGVPIGAVTYTLSGTDAAAFSINAATGVVNMVARNFELPADANADNIYALTITATDTDLNSTSQSWAVNVQDVVEVAVISINPIANTSVNENNVYTSVIPALTGTPIGILTYALGGIDAALFTINSNTGVVNMVVRDFENPADAGGNNVYDLSITVTDADGNSDSEPWSVTVIDVTEAATFTIDAINNASVNENSAYTSVIPAITGVPIGAVTYTLSGTDAAAFSINAATGVVNMVARNFELPADANADNIYALTITATDTDLNSTSQSWAVNVQDVVEVAVISINPIANTSVNENNVYTSVIPAITGTPVGAQTYTLGGADAGLFTINSNTGVVNMVVRDFENPADAGGNNVYNLSLTVTDADGNSDSEPWSVTVVDVTEAATFTIDAINNASVNENSVYTSVIPAITGVPIGAVTYTLSGTDAAAFTINAVTGVVSMVARDFEVPDDANTDNVYDLSISANDVDGNTASLSWAVSVQDITEVSALGIDAIANASVNENSAYTSVTPVLTGTPIGTLTYALGGIDAALFTINSNTGVVSMIARDFESPVDTDLNNVYNLTIIATDSDGNSANQSWAVSVQNVVELIALDDTATVDEGQSVNINLATNDTADNTLDLNSIVITSAPSNGVLVVNVNGTVDYTHDGSETSADSFTYTILDTGGGLSNAATVTLTVNPVNDLPVGNADVFTVDAITATVLDVLANDTDVDGTLTISNVTQGNMGSTVTHNGSVITFTDINNVTGTETFTYDVTDGTAIVTGINVVVNVIANIPNTPPVANDDNVTTTVDTTFFFNVLANDTDADGDVLSVSLPTPNTIPANGSINYNGSGTFTYTPNTGFIGIDSFTYTVADASASSVGTVTITVTPPGAPIDMVTLMSAVEGGVAGIENAEANVYAYWTDNYNLANSAFIPENNLYNHLSGVFDTVVNNGGLLLSGTQWASEGDIIGIDDNNGGLDLTILDANNINVEVARFKLTAHIQDLNNVRIFDHLNTAWQLAMVNSNALFNVGAKLITDYRFEALVESHILGQDNSCQKDGTTKFTDLNDNCNSVDVDAVINATGYAQSLNDLVATTAWVDPADFTIPPGAVTIASNNATNKTLMVQLVSGGAANYYVVNWNSSSGFAFVANAVAGASWVQNTDSGVDMIHFQVPASFIAQFSDDLSNGLNNFLTVQNSYVRQGLKHAIGDTQFSDGHFNGNAFNDILANFSAPVIPGLAELTGTWVNSIASANGDSALLHIFANGNYESSGSCDLDGSTGMEYGTVSSSGSVTNIIALAQIATQGSCGPAQGNKTLTVNGDVLTLSEPGFADIVYNRLPGTLNPIVGSWLLGNIQDPGEAHTILTLLDDTTFTLSQDCATESVSGFEYGTYAVDQSNNLTGTLTIDSNGGCGLHNNTALSISGFTMTVVGDTLTLTDTVGGGGAFTFARISPAYVIPMLQLVYTLDNVMMQPGDGQITGSFTWSYVDGDFAGGSGQFTDLTIPGYGSDIAGLNINFDSQVGIEITLLVNTNNNGVDIIFDFLQPLSPTVGSGINLATSSYNIEIGALQGAFVSGAFTPQLAP